MDREDARLVHFATAVSAFSIVTIGLDPVVYADRRSQRRGRMDCRVKPGNDDVINRSRGADASEFCRRPRVKKIRPSK
jgi:hypothetical protein